MATEAAAHPPTSDPHGHGQGHDHGHAHQFDDADQQHQAALLGMWAFLATEVLLFGGLFLAYAIFRATSPREVAMASHHLSVPLGALNTAILLCSSLTVALAVRAAQLGVIRSVLRNLALTGVLGLTFLGVKAVEWSIDYHEGLIPGAGFRIPEEDAERLEAIAQSNLERERAESPGVGPAQLAREDPLGLHIDKVKGRYQLFFVLYFCMTGLHAAHMVVGLSLFGVVAWIAWRKRHRGGYANTVEITGLYWHFVDIVWVFLYPLLYLIDPHL